MPSHPPRSLSPAKQLETLAKREAALRGILTRGGAGPRTAEAAERVRRAHLSVFKARRALIEHKPGSPAKQRQLESIATEESWWEGVTIEVILMKYGPWQPEATE